MLIGELARAASVSAQAIRYYERRGLIRPVGRTRSGYRQYDASAVAILQGIKAGQSLGFTLAEIKPIITSLGSIRAAAERKLRNLRERIAELSAHESRIRQLLDACDCDRTKRCIMTQSR